MISQEIERTNGSKKNVFFYVPNLLIGICFFCKEYQAGRSQQASDFRGVGLHFLCVLSWNNMTGESARLTNAHCGQSDGCS